MSPRRGDGLRFRVVPCGHGEGAVPEGGSNGVARDARLNGERRVRAAEAVRPDERRAGETADAPDGEPEPEPVGSGPEQAIFRDLLLSER